MNEDFVSYQQAVKLKAAGFDWRCIAYWAVEPDGKPIICGSTAFVFTNSELKGRDALAPFMWQAQKWLREVHDWHIIIEPIDWECFSYAFKLYHKFRGYENANRGFYFPTYERALSDAIDMVLERIEKKGE